MNIGDIGISIIIAIVIILIYFFIFPGLYKTTAYDLEGYWYNNIDQIYKIIPTSTWYFNLVSADGIFHGRISGIRGVYINFINTELKGIAESDNRFINWSNGMVWNKQAF